MDVQINYLAVFLAAVSTMVVGSIWYAPSVFGKTWAKLAKVDLNRKVPASEMTWLMGSTFVASIVTAYILAHVAFLSNSFFQNSFMQDTVSTAFWLWLGFTAARLYVHDAFENRRKKLTVLAVCYEFVTIMLMAIIIGAFGY
jgi:hypothetical protein